MISVEEIRAEAKAMSSEERGALISGLIEDLGHPNYDVSDEEVARRVAETDDGSVLDISHDELVSGLNLNPKN